jgi:cellulose synthase/poly-beta-1,6-N-acetylglucosamine synthase-like glycosyltransferase
MSLLAIAGWVADIVLILGMVLQCLLGYRILQTAFLYLTHRRAGLRRERELLALPMPPDDSLPRVLVQVPTFNEGSLIRRALEAVTALDWPRDRLQIQLLDDSTDDSAALARAAVEEYRGRGHPVVLLQRRTRTGFKAGALKAGLDLSTEPFVAIFDADYVPRRDFLRQCLRPLLAEPDLAFAQARCDFLNAGDNPITRAQQVILESHFGVEQATRSWAGQFLPFNGTCGVWRRAAIAAAGGWHGDTLTEDLDLSYRAQLAGWRALYLVSVAVPGELPDTLGTWQRQQFRWNKGFAQTARKLLPIIWRSALPPHRKFEALLHLGGCTFGVLSIVTFAALVADLALGSVSSWIVVPLLAIAAVESLAGALAMALLSRDLLEPLRGEHEKAGLVARCVITLYTIAMHAYAGVMTAWGVLDGMRGRDSSFVRTPKKGQTQRVDLPSPETGR